MEVDQTTIKFVDLARQMEAFFIQKRFLLSALKPELVLKEENFDLRYEMTRKDDLIRRHYEKIEQWKNLLTDLQQQGGAASDRSAASAVGPNNPPSQPGQLPIAGMPNHMVVITINCYASRFGLIYRLTFVVDAGTATATNATTDDAGATNEHATTSSGKLKNQRCCCLFICDTCHRLM